MRRLDAWMAANPWHVRLTPFMAYLLLMMLTGALRDSVSPWLFPPAYALQCGVVVWLLWRYRALLPELNLKFHWTAVPAGLFVLVMWIVLGDAMMAAFPSMAGESFLYLDPGQMHPALGWTSMVLRLVGMSLVVPLFEELWTRSLLLRSLHSPRQTAIGLVNLAQDMPILDDLIGDTKLARRAGRHHGVFARMFEQTPLGQLSWFGIAASTFVFMLAHVPRDWPGCVVCGVTYCLVVGYTNRGGLRKGLGPAIWAHAITNAALWAYSIAFNDWHYLP